jgi:hypothetical protein
MVDPLIALTNGRGAASILSPNLRHVCETGERIDRPHPRYPNGPDAIVYRRATVGGSWCLLRAARRARALPDRSVGPYPDPGAPQSPGSAAHDCSIRAGRS